ncbi:MAG: hypothetical protein LBI87_06670, partial [Candidatus Accumulibacter sp.]|nr:hypothetical protein [Accumulibacter sp.]
VWPSLPLDHFCVLSGFALLAAIHAGFGFPPSSPDFPQPAPAASILIVIPANAGMTLPVYPHLIIQPPNSFRPAFSATHHSGRGLVESVILAKAGIQDGDGGNRWGSWIPACAGVAGDFSRFVFAVARVFASHRARRG